MFDHQHRLHPDDHHDGQRSGPNDSHAGEPTQPERAATTVGSRDVWRASASFGWLIGVLLLLLTGGGIILMVARVPSSTGGQRIAWVFIAAVLTALAVGIAVLLRALPTMRYRFAGDALIVEWLGQQRVVPLAEIEAVTFEPNEPIRLPRWEPFWPGYYVATVRTPIGVWHSWATQQPRRRVRLTTSHGIVAISPERPVRFVTELERRRRAVGLPAIAEPAAVSDEPVERQRSATRAATAKRPMPNDAHARGRRLGRPAQPHRHPAISWLLAYRDLFRNHLLLDQIASAMVAAGVVLPVLMVAYLYSQFEGLPNQIPIHWDAAGAVDEVTTPGGLWRFPRIAVAILIINTALATLLIGLDRYLARLLVAGTVVAHILLFVALVRAIA